MKNSTLQKKAMVTEPILTEASYLLRGLHGRVISTFLLVEIFSRIFECRTSYSGEFSITGETSSEPAFDISLMLPNFCIL